MAISYMKRDMMGQNPSNVSTSAGPWSVLNLAYSATGDQDAIILPDGGRYGIVLTAAAGTSKIQVSCTAQETIVAGGTVVWADLKYPVDMSAVASATLYGLVEGATAIRVSVTSGTATVQVRA